MPTAEWWYMEWLADRLLFEYSAGETKFIVYLKLCHNIMIWLLYLVWITSVTIIQILWYLLGVVGEGFLSLLKPMKPVLEKIERYEWPITKERKERRARRKAQERILAEMGGVSDNSYIRAVPRILGARQRSLSIGKEDVENLGELDSPVSGDVVKRKTDTQDQSRLFELPFELREKIWREVVGGYVIHIYYVYAYRRVQHARCKTLGEPWDCRFWLKQEGALDHWGQSHLLSLLLACRRTYTESIRILYETNVFDFVCLEDVFRFSLVLAPNRLSWLRNVQWRKSYRRDRQDIYTSMPWQICSTSMNCQCLKCVRGRASHCEIQEQYEMMTTWALAWEYTT